MAEGEKIRVVVNVGVLMVVLMTAADYRHNAPQIGEQVALEISGKSCTFLPA